MDLAFEAGEIHAIVGENGAGKSTLIKLLTGVHLQIRRRHHSGRAAPSRSPAPQDAIALGINAVHQEVVLCRHLTVAANLFLGNEHTSLGVLHKARMEREAQRVLDDLGFAIPAGVVLSTLTIGQQQLVATARAALRGTRFLIFDEPTAYLTRQEAAQLFALIRRLKARGVTHRLYQPPARGGVRARRPRLDPARRRAVSTERVAETDEQRLIRGMIARSIEQIYHKDAVPPGAELVSTPGPMRAGFRGHLDRRAAGRDRWAVRADRRRAQRVRADAVRPLSAHRRQRALGGPSRLTINSPQQAIALGMALVPESRRDQGLCLNLGVSTNLNLPIFDRLTRAADHRRPGGGASGRRADRRPAHRHRQPRDAGAVALGRQPAEDRRRQVARAWRASCSSSTSRRSGVDVGTKVEIYRLFGALLQKGAGIILISSYLPGGL